MKEEKIEIRTPKNGLHLGDLAKKNGEPALDVIRKGKEEVLDIADIACLLYATQGVKIVRKPEYLIIIKMRPAHL